MVVKAAEDRLGCDGAEVLNRAMDRSVLAQRPIGPCLIIHYVVFQMADVAVPRELFQEILRLIEGPRPRPAPA